MKLHVSSSFMVSYNLKFRFKNLNLVTQKKPACQYGVLLLFSEIAAMVLSIFFSIKRNVNQKYL